MEEQCEHEHVISSSSTVSLVLISLPVRSRECYLPPTKLAGGLWRQFSEGHLSNERYFGWFPMSLSFSTPTTTQSSVHKQVNTFASETGFSSDTWYVPISLDFYRKKKSHRLQSASWMKNNHPFQSLGKTEVSSSLFPQNYTLQNLVALPQIPQFWIVTSGFQISQAGLFFFKETIRNSDFLPPPCICVGDSLPTLPWCQYTLDDSNILPGRGIYSFFF